MTASQHTIAGTVLTMPVQIRKATQHMATFSVDADAAQRLIDYSGLKVARFRPGRAAVALILAHFIDGDLGEYHELSTSVMVNQPGSNVSGPRALHPPSFITCLSTKPSLLKRDERFGAFQSSWRTSRFRSAVSSASTAASTGNWWSRWNFAGACRFGWVRAGKRAQLLAPRRCHARDRLRARDGRCAHPIWWSARPVG